ncbi:hypothetical protein B0H10DRAFT_738735 [Mycena sp. CBHHK59/15]|nr:hypothetical protein B0H10DRAFT_738735 [Mycena sp. CBHHK59/15]
MWSDMPHLMDGPPGGFIPPPNAVTGGHPEIHSTFPGHQQPQQQHNWFHGSGQSTPWSTPTAPSWANSTPGPSWANSGPSPSWANTPGPSPHGASPWQQNQFQTPPGWTLPPPPRQGWGPAAQPGFGGGHSGMGGPQMGGSPWGEGWGQHPPPQSAPAGLSGFSATAAPPPMESSSGQPITGTSWFNGGASGGFQGHRTQGEMQGGMPAGMPGGMMPGGQWGEPEPEHEWDMMRSPWAQLDGLDLHRTNSLGQPKSRPKNKKRSNSFGGGQLQGFGNAVVFDEHHLSPRPEDWRDGYSPRTGMSADLSFSSFFRVGKKSDPNEFADTKKRSLCDPLTYNMSRPNIAFDVRCSPDETSDLGNFRPRGQSDMLMPAVRPEATRMRLVHPRLPWFVDVRRGQHAPYVTLYDVLITLYEELDRPIAGRDFWNEELGARERADLTQAFKDRCYMDGKQFAREQMSKGVKRADFLGTDVIFVGLVRRSGMWEIKTMAD